MSSAPFPWHRQQWQLLDDCRRQQRLPHSLLLTGAKGLGKTEFARQLAHSLLCQTAHEMGRPCGQCRNCQLMAAGSHPDHVWVEPAADKKAITVDQIRELGQFLSLTAQAAGHKVVVIAPAEAMNVNAANSLLKTLEEPTAGSVLILVSHRPAMLTATIRSRCQHIRFTGSRDQAVVDWLNGQLDATQDCGLLLSLADGAPLIAREMADKDWVAARLQCLSDLEQLAAKGEDPIVVGQRWEDGGLRRGLTLMDSWITDMIRLKTAHPPPLLTNSDIASRLQVLAARLPIIVLFRQLDRVNEALRRLDGNFNPLLIAEEIMIGWADCFRDAA